MSAEMNQKRIRTIEEESPILPTQQHRIEGSIPIAVSVSSQFSSLQTAEPNRQRPESVDPA
jgi:hypothetical protein